jgi:hypothetical protein
MNPTSVRAAKWSVKGQDGSAAPPMTLGGLAWRSALLNLAIVLTALPVLAYAGGPDALVPALAVIAVISAVLWVATFTVYFLVSIVRVFLHLGVRGFAHAYRRSGPEGGLADEWVDGPG